MLFCSPCLNKVLIWVGAHIVSSLFNLAILSTKHLHSHCCCSQAFLLWPLFCVNSRDCCVCRSNKIFWVTKTCLYGTNKHREPSDFPHFGIYCTVNLNWSSWPLPLWFYSQGCCNMIDCVDYCKNTWAGVHVIILNWLVSVCKQNVNLVFNSNARNNLNKIMLQYVYQMLACINIYCIVASSCRTKNHSSIWWWWVQNTALRPCDIGFQPRFTGCVTPSSFPQEWVEVNSRWLEWMSQANLIVSNLREMTWCFTESITVVYSAWLLGLTESHGWMWKISGKSHSCMELVLQMSENFCNVSIRFS